MMQVNKHNKTSEDTGWQQMNNLLNKEMPVATVASKKSKRRYSVLLLLLLIGSCGVYRFWIKDTDNSFVENKKIKDADVKRKDTDVKIKDADGKIKDADGKMKVADGKMKVADAKMKDADVKMKDADVKMKVADVKTKVSDVKMKVADVKTKVSDVKMKVADVKMRDADVKMKVADVKTKDADVSIAEIKKTSQANNKKSEIHTSEITKSEITKSKISKSQIKYGLEWSLPFAKSNSSFINNTTNNDLKALLPAAWISKDVSAKSFITVKCNPYAQHLTNITTQQNSFTVAAQTASNSVNTSDNLSQNISINKLIGVDISVAYTYSLNKNWNVNAGLANTFITSAIINDRVIKNESQKIKDNFYSIDKGNAQWNGINTSFFTANLSVSYNYKKYSAGARIVQPLTTIYNQSSPVNYQLFFGYQLK